MKTCQKCRKDYPDDDNFCPECGAKLRPKAEIRPPVEALQIHNKLKHLERKIETRPKTEFIHFNRRLGGLEKKVKSIPKPVPSRDFIMLKNKMANLEQRIGNETKQLKTTLKEVDKKAERMGKLKFIPKEDALSIVKEISDMEKKISDLNTSITRFREEMPRTEHILMEIEERLKETSGALFAKQQHQLEEMQRKINMIEARVEGTEKDIEEAVERMKKGGVEAEISRFLRDVNENKQKIAKLEEMKRDFEEMKKRSASFNAQEIKENILMDFEKINTNLVESIEKKKSEIQRLEQETAQMREGIESLKNLEGKIKGIDSETITRDLEILKTKTKWLEEQIEDLNIKPLHDRIQELETDLKRVTSSSPLVVE